MPASCGEQCRTWCSGICIAVLSILLLGTTLGLLNTFVDASDNLTVSVIGNIIIGLLLIAAFGTLIHWFYSHCCKNNTGSNGSASGAGDYDSMISMVVVPQDDGNGNI